MDDLDPAVEARHNALEDGAALVCQKVHLVDDEQPARCAEGSAPP